MAPPRDGFLESDISSRAMLCVSYSNGIDGSGTRTSETVRKWWVVITHESCVTFAAYGNVQRQQTCGQPVHLGEVLADGMVLVPLHPAFPLLEVDRIRGQVPVHDGVAPEMEVETLLADGRGPLFAS